MCEPNALAITMGAIAGIQTIGGIVAQNRQAQTETQAALDASYWDRLALLEQDRQQAQRFSLQALERQRQAMRDRATMTVAAGEVGVAGNSLLRMLQHQYFKEGYDIGIQRTNLEAARRQTQTQAQRVWATQQSRVQSAQARRVNPFLGALQIGSNVATSYFGVPRIGG